MKIKVKYAEGAWELPLVVKPNLFVSALKKAIYEAKGVPVELQHLFARSVELNDLWPISLHAITSGITITLKTDVILTVNARSNKDFTMEVDLYDTVEALKKQIRMSMGIQPDLQTLYTDSSLTRELDDSRALLHYGTAIHHRLFLVTFEDCNFIKVSAQTDSGKQFKMRASLSETVLSLKQRMAKKLGAGVQSCNCFDLKFEGNDLEDHHSLGHCGIKSGSALRISLKLCSAFDIKLRNWNNREINLQNIKLSDTIGSIKQKVEHLTGISARVQKLKNHRNEKVLKNNQRSLFDYGILAPAEDLYLGEFRSLRICNDLLGEKILPTNEFSKISLADLKKNIKQSFRVGVNEQVLSFNGFLLGEDDKKLSAYGIGESSIISLSIRRQKCAQLTTVNIRGPTIQVRITMNPSDTIDLIKNKAVEILGNEISLAQGVRLGHGSIANATGTLSSNGIKSDEVIDLIPPLGSMKVNIKTLAGKVFELHVGPATLLDEVKEMIEAFEGMPVDQQRLIYAGRQLEDGRTIADCNIEKECAIMLVERLRGC